jgi:hypothetical protein
LKNSSLSPFPQEFSVSGIFEQAAPGEEGTEFAAGMESLSSLSTDSLVLLGALDQDFSHELRQFEEDKHMPYVTSVERRGFEQGLQQGQLQATREMLLETVATRFGEMPQDVTAAVQRLETVEPLCGLLRQALTCASLEAFRDALRTVQG